MTTSVSFCSICTPNKRKISIVRKQSSPERKLLILVRPSAMDPNIIARCDIDLSPGMINSPCNGCTIGFNFFSNCLPLFIFPLSRHSLVLVINHTLFVGLPLMSHLSVGHHLYYRVFLKCEYFGYLYRHQPMIEQPMQ